MGEQRNASITSRPSAAITTTVPPAWRSAASRIASAELPREWVEEVDEVEDDDEAGDGKEGGEGSGKRRSSKPFRLSDPEGLLFSNEAISTVFARLDERLERSTGSAV